MVTIEQQLVKHNDITPLQVKLRVAKFQVLAAFYPLVSIHLFAGEETDDLRMV
jgi:hypothetical protein